jgi:hypothetical protein
MSNEESVTPEQEEQKLEQGQADKFLKNCEKILNLTKEMGMDESMACMALSLNIAVMIEDEGMAVSLIKATYKQLRDSYEVAKQTE